MINVVVDVNGDFLGFLNTSGEIIPKENLITERIKKNLE